MRKMATQHHCVHRSNPDLPGVHTQGGGMPKRKRCAYCGGDLVTEHGLHGVFVWQADGRYPYQDAESVYYHAWAAQARADLLNDTPYDGGGMVVRWIPETAIPVAEGGKAR